MMNKLVPVIIERIHNFSEVTEMADQGEFDYYVSAPEFDESKIIWKTDTLDQAKEHLKKVHALLSDYSGSWDSEGIKSALWDYAESVGRGSVLWPMRYTLSGRDKSPDPFTLAYILGKEETLKRISSVIE